MKTNLDGFNVKEITLYTEQDIQPGMTVTIDDDYKAVIPEDCMRFTGICTGRKGDYITVAVSGVMTARFSSANLSPGYNSISADGNGNLKLDGNTAIETLVLEFDKNAKLVKILL